MRKCAICRELFAPRSMTHKVCGQACAEAVAEQIRLKLSRKADMEKRQSMKSRKDHERETQQAINAWVRLVRDKDQTCISCGRWHEGQWHAGHYLSRGARPNLALEESNIAKQCMPCNVHLSGNQINFRIGLIGRIGLATVEALEMDQVPRKYSIADLNAIKAMYKSRMKGVANGPENRVIRYSASEDEE
jgi:hypothetical protein